MRTANYALALFASLIVGCRETESDAGGVKPVETHVTVTGQGEADFSDPRITKKILAEAVDEESLLLRAHGLAPEGAAFEPKSNRPFTGWAKVLYPSGNIQSIGHYKEGKDDGLSIGWYESGAKNFEAHYGAGKPEGVMTQWHENGQKAKEVHFRGGKREGLVTTWDEDGIILKQELYEDDMLRRRLPLKATP
jgi:hypothetical protein